MARAPQLGQVVERYMEEHKISNIEGNRGVENLAKLVHALGYKDPLNNYGAMLGGATLSDLLYFLADNSGAIEAVIGFIRGQRSPEWMEALGGHNFVLDLPRDAFPNVSGEQITDILLGNPEGGDDSFVNQQEIVTVEDISINGRKVTIVPAYTMHDHDDVQERLQDALNTWCATNA